MVLQYGQRSFEWSFISGFQKSIFDCVNDQFLLNKLAMYGVRGRLLNWFESYLSNRKQPCKLNNIFSGMRQTKTGLPQGSNLGPLLFLAYVKDLPNCLDNASASMFFTQI